LYLGIGASSSAAYTLRKHYTKHLFPFECKFDRGGVDPQPLINQVETSTKKKGKSAAPVPSPGSSNSQDSFPGPNNNNTNSSSMDGFNSTASSNYPSYGQPHPGGEYGAPPGGSVGPTPSPLARTPGPPPSQNTQQQQAPQHPGGNLLKTFLFLLFRFSAKVFGHSKKAECVREKQAYRKISLALCDCELNEEK
jgi:AT-rich interactive domain-containing protein 1